MKLVISTHSIAKIQKVILFLYNFLLFLLADATSYKLAGAGGFKLINQLDEEDKSTILKIIDSFLTKKKFKEFFNKNVASL
ncbi:hypothetical protein LPB138_08840 [Urechidicola croceus]|uniref:Uncharacterized protein n=1 Tax=Urechidicola croceus TaxID=1850246 RepID=A0A1D8P882_9FLAO|nr:hypothetical protein LPB138_08840 [Urechidicola croceus]